MSEEVSIHIGVPTVRQTKMLGYTGTVEVRAQTGVSAFSVRYRQREQVPTITERLLVAVLSGVHPEWLPGDPDDAQSEEPVPITFEAVSAKARGGNDPSRAELFDVLHLAVVSHNRMRRLHVAMTNEGTKTLYSAAVLSKGQVTQMLAALIAIYPQLHEDEGGGRLTYRGAPIED